MKKYSFKIIIYNVILLLSVFNSGFAQQPLFTGTVTDETGKPLPDAVVSVREQPAKEEITDKDGKFSISALAGQTIQIITRDHRYKVIRVNESPISITIDNTNKMIPLGFGMNQAKEEITSAIGIVRSDELSKSSVINPANALFGKIPGLSVLQNGGTSWQNDPGLIIRGLGTYRDASILVLVDGFERPISSLSLPEIESVAILKDAAALAMYGQRGANGVLLVTTKIGNNKGMKVDASYERGITQATRLPHFLNARDYALAINEALANDGLTPQYTTQDLADLQSGNSPFLYPNVNWIDNTLRNFGSTDNMNVTFQGNTRTIRYFSLINYQNDIGLLKPVNDNKGYDTQFDYSKINFRTNLDVDLTKSTRFKVNIAGNLRESKQPGSSPSAIMSSIYSTSSALYPVKTYHNRWGGISSNVNNPVALISATGNSLTHTRELLADMQLEQKLDFILQGLSVEGAISNDNSASYLDNNTKQFQIEQLTPVRNTATGTIVDTLETLYGTNTTLSYASSLSNQWRNFAVWGKIKYSTKWSDNSISSVLIYQQSKRVGNGQFATFLNQSVAGSMHYSKAGKYLADLTVSYSGSNVLPEKDRFDFCPALSLAWNLSDEEWFKRNSNIDVLKIRASYGVVGNNLVPQNVYDQKFTMAGSNYFFTANSTAASGFVEGQLGSPGIKAEKSYKANIGMDAGLFGKLEMNLDIFCEQRKDILTNGIVSTVIGVTAPYHTQGIVNNKGVELGLNFHDKIGDVICNIGGQFAFTRNKIVEMGEVYRPFDYLKRTGQSIGQLFGLEAIGFFRDNQEISGSPKQLFSAVKPGDIKYKDQNNDGIIDQYDEISIGFSSQNPELYYSWTLSFEWKGIGIDALFQGTGNQTLYLNTPSIFWPLRGTNNISDFSDNRWTVSNASNANLPRLSMEESSNNYRPNSVWFKDGSYLKLRSLELYYNLPKRLISKFKFTNTRIYLRGMNLLSFDKIKVVDPEAISIIYPTLASCNFGIQIGF